ncbi:MAG: ribonuclease [Candidatus Adlerbacteria bacterium]|nr:ribonuclease [Candidatus Adlerbacteria bacterium]
MEKGGIIIFTDGASKGNPGRGGWGAIVATPTHVRELGGRQDAATNNQMELMAAVEALTYAATVQENFPVTVYADSSYVINGITKWVKGWKRNDWKTKTGGQVANRDLWEQLADAVENISSNISWEYVGGHVEIAGNERVDTIASDLAEKLPVSLYDGARAAYTVDVENISHSAEALERKSAGKSRSRSAAYSYVSLVDGTVMTHKTWGECEARVKGKIARFKKAASAAEESSIIADFSKR